MVTRFQLLDSAIDEDAYDWLTQYAPAYVQAISDALNEGATPQQIRWYVSARVGADRQALALRCEQAAHHIAKQG